jgi:RNA polymerase sigma factor (sigma-70 family)
MLLIDPRTRQTLADAPETDAELVRRYSTSRDERAFEILLARHCGHVFGRCLRLVGASRADDAFQAVWVTFMIQARTLRDGQALGRWLATTCKRVCLADMAHPNRRELPLTDATNLPDRKPDVSQAPAGEEIIRLIEEEIANLPDRVRTVFVLHCIEKMDRTEISKRLGISIATCDRDLAAARAQLAQRLTGRGVTLEAGLMILASASVPAPVAPALLQATLTAALQGATVPLAQLGITVGARWLVQAVLRRSPAVSWATVTSTLLVLAITTAWALTPTTVEPTQVNTQVGSIPVAPLVDRLKQVMEDEVIPRLKKALQKMVVGKGSVDLDTLTINDRNITVVVRIRHESLLPDTQLAFNYNIQRQHVGVRYDLVGTGTWQPFQPQRAVVLVDPNRPGLLGGELSLSLTPVQEAVQAFDVLPLPDEQIEERTRAWQTVPRPTGTWTIPGPIRCMTVANNIVFVQTTDEWLWACDRSQPVPEWKCIGACPGVTVSAKGSQLLTQWNHRLWTRPATLVPARWAVLHESQDTVPRAYFTAGFHVFLRWNKELLITRAEKPMQLWVSLGTLDSDELAVDSGQIYRADLARALARRPATLTKDAPWENLGELPVASRLLSVEGGRIYALVETTGQIVSRLAESPADEWCIEGVVMLVPRRP